MWGSSAPLSEEVGVHQSQTGPRLAEAMAQFTVHVGFQRLPGSLRHGCPCVAPRALQPPRRARPRRIQRVLHAVRLRAFRLLQRILPQRLRAPSTVQVEEWVGKEMATTSSGVSCEEAEVEVVASGTAW